MSDAPERIFVWPDEIEYGWISASIANEPLCKYLEDTKVVYVREDVHHYRNVRRNLARRRIAELEIEIDRLKARIEEIESIDRAGDFLSSL